MRYTDTDTEQRCAVACSALCVVMVLVQRGCRVGVAYRSMRVLHRAHFNSSLQHTPVPSRAVMGNKLQGE
jgi:hypothetical protein